MFPSFAESTRVPLIVLHESSDCSGVATPRTRNFACRGISAVKKPKRSGNDLTFLSKIHFPDVITFVSEEKRSRSKLQFVCTPMHFGENCIVGKVDYIYKIFFSKIVYYFYLVR